MGNVPIQTTTGQITTPILSDVIGKGVNGVIGVAGTSDSGDGVYGLSGSGHGVSGVSVTSDGLWGESTSGPGVSGTSTSGAGVSGTSASGPAVLGTASSSAGLGVSGVNNNAGPCTAILGTSTNGHGIHGINAGISGVGSGKTPPSVSCGVWGDSDQGYGVYGSSNTGNAGGFDGNVTVTGTVTANGDVAAGVIGGSTSGPGVSGTSTSGPGVLGTASTSQGLGVSGINNNAWPCTAILGTSSNGHGGHGINVGASGVGSGKTLPSASCGVWGDSDQGYGVYGSSNTGNAGGFDGNVSVTGNVTVTGTVSASDVTITGQDFAEDFDIATTTQLEPGTVVVFDGDGAISQCTQPYNKRAAGVISGAGNYRPGVVLGRVGAQGKGKAPVALMGRVFCKVDASYSPIEVGDMLTTSPTSGFAMRASDPSKAFGAVIGKALAAVDEGCELIPILVTLQ